ncbi:unnamed protein product [Cuscuta campestris]|uniref:EF-hand domain-containing protein n=1 Tax=Cuscuta campestris TaxID=132261 RepID=A0A484MEP1_9ASTE|nr:unnamed protein product [Cuscuta campestris]
MAANANPNPKSGPTVCPQDADEVQKVFEKFDANGDGKISAEELSGVLSALGTELSPEELNQVMDEIDTDKDGFINLPEFADFCKGDGGSKELRDAFDLYDADKDGLISAKELHEILTRLGVSTCSVEECQKMIGSVDSDGDGSVNFSEFEKMMTKKQ